MTGACCHSITLHALSLGRPQRLDSMLYDRDVLRSSRTVIPPLFYHPRKSFVEP